MEESYARLSLWSAGRGVHRSGMHSMAAHTIAAPPPQPAEPPTDQTPKHSIFTHQVAGHGSSSSSSSSSTPSFSSCFLSHRRRRSLVGCWPLTDGSAAHTQPTPAGATLTLAHKNTATNHDNDEQHDNDDGNQKQEEEEEESEHIEEETHMHESTILKPIPNKPKGDREQRFYSELQSMRDEAASQHCKPASTLGGLTSLQLSDWLSFFPRYHGVLFHHQIDSSHHFLPHPTPNSSSHSIEPIEHRRFLHLEDLTRDYAHPTIIDVKIGGTSHDPFECDETSEKALREAAKCPSQATIGYRFCGARLLTSVSSSGVASYDTLDKHWCRSIDSSDSAQDDSWWRIFGLKLSARQAASNDPRARRPTDAIFRTATIILPLWIDRLQRLEQLCTEAPIWRLYASSILFAYELQPKPRATLHLIDFSHAYRIDQLPPNTPSTTCASSSSSSSIDSNYLIGVRSLLRCMRRMLNRAIDAVGTVPTMSATIPTPTSPSSHGRHRSAARPKLAVATRRRVVQRKTLAAAMASVRRRFADQWDQRSIAILDSFVMNFPWLISELALTPSFRPGVACSPLRESTLRDLVSSDFVARVAGILSRMADMDACNTSFVQPEHTTELIAAHGHPRTRQWNAELKEQKRIEDEANAEIMRKALSLKAFDAGRAKE